MKEVERISVVLVTHGAYGRALIGAAEELVGWLEIEVVEIVDLDTSRVEIRRRIEELTGGGPALLLTDLCGSTPANVCLAMANERDDREVLAGVNLPMLIRLATGDRSCGTQAAGERLARLACQLQQTTRRSVQRGGEMEPGRRDDGSPRLDQGEG